MNRAVIWKYELENRETEIEMPYGAQVIHVDNQYGKLCLWAIVNPSKQEQRMETRVFWVVHTGKTIDMPTMKEHIGTVLMQDGTYVAHVFEVE